MNLANKYRPKSFKTFLGYETITDKINSQLSKDEIPQKWLITGDKGSGKTSLSRIMARKILKVSIKEDLYPHEDYEEINIGADKSIDKMRQIIEESRFKPKRGGYKVIVLDECHMLKEQSASAILKILEEPPKYIVFILVTNEPHRILPTIKDRIKQIYLPGISENDLFKVLERIVMKEELENKIITTTIKKISQNFVGEMRSAINVIEELAALDVEKLDENSLKAAISSHIKFDMMQASDIMSYLYKQDFSQACQLSLQVEDVSYLVNGMLMLNDYIIRKRTGVPVFKYNAGNKLGETIQKEKITLQTNLQVQEVLFCLKKEITMYQMIDPKQLVLVYVAKIALAIKE